ncbi:MAG: cytosolic protein [Anaerolineales bacterium]|nr:cytosolic protein [Anaerolineales bacterium]
MRTINLEDVRQYVEENISVFHQQRLDSLQRLKLSAVLKRKNPYLYKAKNILLAQDLIKSLLEAHLSSNEETIFGDFLENLARFVSAKTTSGRKSSTRGIDLEFEAGGTVYLVTIKSGPNWGNSGQIDKMVQNFKTAKKILGTNSRKTNVIAVNGCCYGIDNKPDKGDYLKLCGQAFWTFISGNEDLYIEIIEPLGFEAKRRNDDFVEEYSKILNVFTQSFMEEFCVNGEINWAKLVRFNSEANRGLLDSLPND